MLEKILISHGKIQLKQKSKGTTLDFFHHIKSSILTYNIQFKLYKNICLMYYNVYYTSYTYSNRINDVMNDIYWDYIKSPATNVRNTKGIQFQVTDDYHDYQKTFTFNISPCFWRV